MKEDRKADILSKAVKKFLDDVNTIPPWKSAGAVWSSRLKELHSAWCDYEVDKLVERG